MTHQEDKKMKTKETELRPQEAKCLCGMIITHLDPDKPFSCVACERVYYSDGRIQDGYMLDSNHYNAYLGKAS